MEVATGHVNAAIVAELRRLGVASPQEAWFDRSRARPKLLGEAARAAAGRSRGRVPRGHLSDEDWTGGQVVTRLWSATTKSARHTALQPMPSGPHPPGRRGHHAHPFPLGRDPPVAGALAIVAPAAASAAVPAPPAVVAVTPGYTETVCPHGLDHQTADFHGALDISTATIAASPGA